MRPLIGITMHVADTKRPDGSAEWRFQVLARYAAAVVAGGGVPLFLPTLAGAAAPMADSLDALDGLLLSGGGSIPGQYFEQNPDPTLRQTNPQRYDFEAELTRAAWGRGMPLLGICRGHQTLSQALGGPAVLNLGSVPGSRNHYQTQAPPVATHDATFESGSRLAAWVGPSARINSFHRQVVTLPPPGWAVTARSDDGWVEAIESSSGFGVGVQFHPESLMESQPAFGALFRDFVTAAAEYGSANRG